MFRVMLISHPLKNWAVVLQLFVHQVVIDWWLLDICSTLPTHTSHTSHASTAMVTYSLETPIIIKFLSHLEALFDGSSDVLDESLVLDISIILNYDESIYSPPPSSNNNNNNNEKNNNNNNTSTKETTNQIDLTNVSPIIDKILNLLQKDSKLNFYFRIDPKLKLIEILKTIFNKLAIDQLISFFDM